MVSEIVAPFTGAWIEIKLLYIETNFGTMSLPSRGRGLKLEMNFETTRIGKVAPFTGAWIEIQQLPFLHD